MSGYVSSIDIGEDDNQILVAFSNYGVSSVWETIGGGGANGWIDIEGDLPDMPIRWGLYNKNNFNQKIDELNQETETLKDEIDKWQT